MFVLGVPDNPEVDSEIFSRILIRQLVRDAVVDLKFPKDVSSIGQNGFKNLRRYRFESCTFMEICYKE